MDSTRERRTKRLLLRPVAWEDHDAFVEIHADPRANAHTPGGPPTEDWIEGMLAGIVGVWESSAHSYWAVEMGGRLIGVAGVERHTVLGRECWNLYYRFTPRGWGKGYATEVARAAVDVAELLEPARPVVARTRATNAPAIRVAERAGLVRRPDLDHDGYLVLAARW